MRTVGQGQAAGFLREGVPPKGAGPAWAVFLGRGRTSCGLSQTRGALSCRFSGPLLQAERGSKGGGIQTMGAFGVHIFLCFTTVRACPACLTVCVPGARPRKKFGRKLK